MSQLDMSTGEVVAYAEESERAGFIKRTYLHVAGGIAVFALLLSQLISLGFGEMMMGVLGKSQFSWLIVLGLFMAVSYVANRWAHSGLSRGLQYAGFGLFIVAEAIIFLPLVYMALQVAPDGSLLKSAALITATLVAGLTFTAVTTKKDFSFLGRYLAVGGFVALGLIVAAIAFGFTLGVFFSGAMIVFAGASVLYSTSQILHQYHSSQHVAAALSLFSGIALMFWYVLQFLMSMMGRD